MQKKYNLTITNTATNAVVYNAKGDLLPGGTAQSGQVGSTTFLPVAAIASFLNNGNIAADSVLPPPSAWVDTGAGGFNGAGYTIAWSAPFNTGVQSGIGIPTVDPSGSGNGLLSTNRSFSVSVNAESRAERTWNITITNNTTFDTESWSVNVSAEAISGGGGGV